MNMEQRRDLLREELVNLLDICMELRARQAGRQVETPFLIALEAQMEEKTAELERLNAVVDTPRFQIQKRLYEHRVLWALVALVEFLSGTILFVMDRWMPSPEFAAWIVFPFIIAGVIIALLVWASGFDL